MGPAVHRSQDRPHSPVGRPLVGRRVRNRNVVVHDAPEVPDPAEVIRGLQTALKASHAQLRHLTSVVIQLKQDLRARTQRREMALQRSLSLSAMSSEPWRVVQAPPPALVDATAVAESNPRADAEAQTDEYVPDSDTSAPEATPKQRRKSRWATATAEAGCQAAPPVACAAQQCDAARCRDWGTQWEDPNAPVERNSLELRRLYDRIMGDDGGPRPDVAPEAAQSGTPRRCSRSGSPRPGPPREPEGVPAAGPTAPSASPELSIPGVPPLPRPSVQVDSVHGSDPSPPDSSRSPSPSPTSSRCPPDSERGFSPAELPAPDSDRRFAPLGLAPPPAAPTRLRSPRILPHALSFDSTDLEFTPLAAAVTSSTGVTPLAPVRPVAVVSVGSQTDGVALSSYRSQSVLAELKAGAALFDESESSVRSDEEQWEEELRKKPPPTDIHFLPTLLRQIHRRVRKFYWLTFLYLQDRYVTGLIFSSFARGRGGAGVRVDSDVAAVSGC